MSLAKKVGAMALTLAAAAPLFGQTSPEPEKYDGRWIAGTIVSEPFSREYCTQFPQRRMIAPGDPVAQRRGTYVPTGLVEFRTVTPDGKAVFAYLCGRGESLQQETYALAKGESLPLGLSCNYVGSSTETFTLDLKVEEIGADGRVTINARIVPHSIEAQETKK